MPSTTWNFTGSDETWTVPADVHRIDIRCAGGSGGDHRKQPDYGGRPGRGAVVYSNKIPVTPGETLTIRVGEQGEDGSGSGEAKGGWPGGGDSARHDTRLGGSAGGGYSGVFRGTTPLIVAGAGGGMGYDRGGTYELENGGNGGRPNGGTGGGFSDCRGRGGTLTSGGAGGNGDGILSRGRPGGYLEGGDGGAAEQNGTSGGGGGSGYYGGGAAGNEDNLTAGGGGGSSLADSFTGLNSGDGYVLIEWVPRRVNVWTGSQWKVVPAMVYDGTTWKEADGGHYDGTGFSNR